MTTAVTAPSGAQTTRRPDVDVTFTDGPYAVSGGPSLSLDHGRLFILPAATFISSIIDPAVPSSSIPHGTLGGAVYKKFTNGYFLTGGLTTLSIPVTEDLPYGELKAVVLLRDPALNGYIMIVGPNFHYTDVPSTPTGLVPADGSSTDTNLPTLGLTLVASGGSTPVRGEWQLASDAGFTSNVRLVTEPTSKLRTSGATTFDVPTVSKLFAGTWYVRGRAKNGADETSGWTAANDFTVAHLPGTTAHSPTGGAVMAYEDGFQTFAWHFTSASPDLDADGPTAYRIELETLDGDPILDTGKVSETDTAVVLEVDDDYIAVALRWRVKAWDTEDVEGDYSDWHAFTLFEPGTVTIDEPDPAEVLSSGLLVEWTFTPSASDAPQATYRVLLKLDDVDETLVWDSGVVYNGDVTELEVPPELLENDTAYLVEVIIRDTIDLEASAEHAFTTDFVEPDELPFEVEASTFDSAGPVTILIGDTTGLIDLDFAGILVRRRLVDGEWEDVITTDVAGAFIRVADYSPRAGMVYEYEVRQLAFRFGSTVASAAPAPESVTLPTSHAFWLLGDEARAVADDTAPAIAELAATSSVRLGNVDVDDFETEVDREELKIIGAGRTYETGESWGRIGNIKAVLADDAHAALVELEDLVIAGAKPTLRKPNGEAFLVSFAITAKPRRRDDVYDVDVDYAEVYA